MCSTGCPTQDHATWGECIRAKSLRTAYLAEWKGADFTRQKRADRRLERYANARKEGIQPRSTRLADVMTAVKQSDQTGTAYRADS